MFKNKTEEKSKEKKQRFKIIHSDKNSPWGEIILDTHTGVQYLHMSSSTGKAITPLLSSDGKVIVDLDSIEIDE